MFSFDNGNLVSQFSSFFEAVPFLPILVGVLLASAAGLRAFFPLCALAWAVHFRIASVGPAFSWLDSPFSLIAFTTAVILEGIGDKFPAVDHLLDGIGAFIKPVAGTILVAAPLVRLDPFWAVVIGIIGGATVSEGIHLVKAQGRLAANLFSFGFAAPVLSFLEDGLAILLILCAFFIPLAGLLILLFILARRRRKKTIPT